MCSLGCPIRNASLKVAYFEVPIPGRFSLPADTASLNLGRRQHSGFPIATFLKPFLIAVIIFIMNSIITTRSTGNFCVEVIIFKE
jgi:hypothetical protein